VRVRQEVKEWLWLTLKTLLLIVGGILVLAALVDLVVAGLSWLAVGILALGLALALPPLAFAFRDAYREARKGRI
jgi:hypothetical protein